MDSKEGQHHSEEEAKEAIQNLPDAYWLRLRRWTTWRLRGNCIATAGDVIADIWERFVRGRRHWPLGVPIGPCFWNAVKSEISSVWEKHQLRAAKQHAPVTADGDSDDPLENLEGTSPDPLEEMIATPERERLQKILDHIYDSFKSEDAVTAVIIGREEKMSPKEVQQTFGLTETQYDSAGKRLRRFINKHYPDGWGSYGQQ